VVPTPAPAAADPGAKPAAKPAPARAAAPAKARCADLLQRLQLGETLSSDDQQVFQKECR
jgi:hypothetical protein